MIIASVPGVGKSVLFRLIYFYVSLIRPILVIDWEGEDHKLSNKPNIEGTNLPPNQEPREVRNAVFLNYTSEKEPHEKRVIPNLNSYSADELRGLGFPLGAAMELRRTLTYYNKKKPFKNIQELFDFIRGFPTNERQANEVFKKRDIKNKRTYDEFDTIPSQTKQSLLKYLFNINEKNMFCLNDKNYENIVELLAQGKNVFLNFNGYIDLCRIETTKIVEELIKYRKRNRFGIAPAVFYEEADRIIPRTLEDQEEKKKIQYIVTVLVEAAKRARKHKIAQYFASPSLSNLNRTICDISNEYIYGRMKGADLVEVKRISGEYTQRIVFGLKFNRYINVRQFVYRNEFDMTFVFEPFESPQDYHREY